MIDKDKHAQRGEVTHARAIPHEIIDPPAELVEGGMTTQVNDIAIDAVASALSDGTHVVYSLSGGKDSRGRLC